jgi:hypothetical protein
MCFAHMSVLLRDDEGAQLKTGLVIAGGSSEQRQNIGESAARATWTPDEVREFPMGRLESMNIAGATFGRAIFEPA